jgi:hypothetical protein
MRTGTLKMNVTMNDIGRDWGDTTAKLCMWHMPVIPALGRSTEEDHELEASLGYEARP